MKLISGHGLDDVLAWRPTGPVRVREALVTFIQREYPDCLPQVRVPAQGAEAPTRTLAQEPPLKA